MSSPDRAAGAAASLVGAGPIRVLMLEDNPDDADQMLRELLRAGLAVKHKRVEVRGEFVWALAEFEPHVVIADYSLPSFDGRAALGIVRSKHPDIPVIMVSGTLDDERAAELMRLGAADFVLKDRPARLAAAVQGAIERAAEVRLRQAEQARFRVLIENVSDVVAMLDGQGVIRYISPSVKALGGYEPAELVGQPFAALLHPEASEPARHPWPATLGVPGAFLVSQSRCRHKDGGWRHFEIVTHNLLHVPEVASMVVVLRDITARRAAEDALRERAAEQERFLRLSVGRELRMVELKREVNEMARVAGRAPAYPLIRDDEGRSGAVNPRAPDNGGTHE